MQPIIIIGAAVVGFALLGTGFLGKPWNDIDLWVQELGWGERNLEAPISHAYIDLELKKVRQNGPDGVPDTSDDWFANLISACSFHSDQDILGVKDPNLGLADALIICKLTNDEGLAIAEGRVTLDGVDRNLPNTPQSECPQRADGISNYFGSDKINIDMCQFAFKNSNEVQEIHDVKIIVEGALERMDPTVPTQKVCGTNNINDYCVDGDGIASPNRGTFNLAVGDVLSEFGYGIDDEGIDVFGTASGVWLIGWTDIHLEDSAGACATGIRDGFHDEGFDCVVLDLDASLFDGQDVDCDLETGTAFTGCPPFTGLNSIKFHDENGDGVYNNGEDIVLDINGNGIFD